MGIKKSRMEYMTLFLLLSGAGIIAFFAFVVPNPNVDAFRWFVMEHNYDWQFGDFFRPVVYTADLKNVYFNTSDAPYPPLAMCFFHLMWRLNPIVVPINLKSWIELSRYQFNPLILLMMTIVEVSLLYIAVRKTLSQYSEKKVNGFFFAILFSAPFFEGAIERGNIALLTMILMLFALYYKDSEKAYCREFALILIAMAAGLKLYPAVLGLLYIKERRWKEAVRLILYGILFCVVPFAFTGGVNGALRYIEILMELANRGASPRWTSIRCFFTAASQYLGLNINVQLIGKCIEKAFLAGSVVAVLLERKNWKKVLYLCSIIAVGVPNCYRYTSIYMLIPLLLFLRECHEKKEKGSFTEIIYVVLFALTFTIPVWAIRREVDFAIYFPIYLTILIGAIETAVVFCSQNIQGGKLK